MSSPRAGRDAPRPGGAFRALRHRDYRLFYAGQSVSLVGAWVQMTALSWLLFRLTRSSTALGVLSVAQFSPGFLLGPLAGAVADRHEKRGIVIAAVAASSSVFAVLAALTLLDVIGPGHVVAFALLLGILFTFEIPARQAFIVEMVGRDDLPSAIGLNSAAYNGARLVGPALAGAAIARWGEGACFMASAAAGLPLLAALAAVRRVPAADGAADRPVLQDVVEGFRFVRSSPPTAALLALVAATTIAGMPYFVLLSAFTVRSLGGTSATYGLLMASVGVGALAGALCIAARPSVRGLERWSGGGTLLFGAGLLGLAAAPTVAAAAAALALLGAGFMVQLAAANTLLQILSPDRLRGRVMALYAALCVGLIPAGGFAAGWAADRIGERPVFAAGGLLILAAGLLFRRALPAFEGLPEVPEVEVRPSPLETVDVR